MYDIPERLVFLVQWVPVSDEEQRGSLVAKVVPEWGWALDGGWQVEFWGLRPWRRPPRPGDRLTVRGLRWPRVGQPLLSLAVNTVHFLLVLRRRRPGILLGAGGWGISGAAAALRLSGHRAPLIVKVNVHSEGDGMARRGHRVVPRIILGVERFVFRTADLVTTVGASTSRFAADAGVAAARIIERSAAVSGRLFAAPPEACRDPMLIACVARLEPRKAVDVLLRAVAEVRATNSGVKVEIAGQGGLRDDLEALAAGLGIADCVTFRGWVPPPDIPALLARATVFVLCSRADEGLPKVVVEAGLAGCAVVGTDVRGTNELVVQGVTGELVPPDDPPALASVLTRLLADPGEVARLAHGAREVAIAHQARHLRRRGELQQRTLPLLSDSQREAAARSVGGGGPSVRPAPTTPPDA